MESTTVIDVLSKNLKLESSAIRLWNKRDDESSALTLQRIPRYLTRLEMNGGGPFKHGRPVQSLMHHTSLKRLKQSSLIGLYPTDTSLLQLETIPGLVLDHEWCGNRGLLQFVRTCPNLESLYVQVAFKYILRANIIFG